MPDQLSARDWLDQGLKALAANGAGALKADPLAKAMGVSRGSFYWHFADVAAFRTAILAHWREVSAERVIADLEAAGEGENPLLLLLRRTFSSRLTLERAVRSWATFDAEARNAVQAVDRRRIDYIDARLKASGFTEGVAEARAQILYWAFVGYALSDKALPKAEQEAVYDELARIALGKAR
ncbi:MAG: TetR/AcrR family transcriptional regulator [Alphaproteobacteria bacterium]|nr:TetR/AcrR family transcriptional regulator [Alphaproteobacteria bacterium]